MLELEKHVVMAYYHVMHMVNMYSKQSKFTEGELAKAIGLEKVDLEKKFKESTLSPKELLEVIKFLESEASKKVDELKQKEDGLDENK